MRVLHNDITDKGLCLRNEAEIRPRTFWTSGFCLQEVSRLPVLGAVSWSGPYLTITFTLLCL